MTSQKSSLSTSRFTFLSALKGNFILPMLNSIVLTVIVPVLSFFSIKNFASNSQEYPYSGFVEKSSEKITDLYKYLIFNQYNQISFNVLIHLSVIIFSILLGIVLFRFIASKKTVNVFYSLGITRKNLFVSKYMAGILMLAVSITVPFIACLIINISVFGSSAELWSAIIFHIIGYCAISLTAFSLTAAIFSCVGTIIEGITFSGIILLGPTMVFYSIQFLMKKLTLGSPYGHFYDAGYQVNSLANSLSKLNPILFLFENVKNIGFLSRESTESKFVWNAPDYGNTIIWFFISAALFGLGIYFFQKRKAEICGFLGINKPLNFIVIFLIGFFALSVALSINSSVTAGLIVGVFIYIFLYMIIDFALIRNLKGWVKGFVKLPAHLGLALLIVIVFSTGLLGFSSRIPTLEKIDSAEITPVTYSGLLDPYNSNGNGDGEFIYSVSTGKLLDGLKSEHDLKTVIDLHNLFIHAGKLTSGNIDYSLTADKQVTSSDVKIIYHLKNGRTVNRYYDKATLEIINSMLTIDKTDRYNELIIRNLTEPASESDNDEVKKIKDFFQSSDSEISVLPNLMNVSNVLTLDAAGRVQLLGALAADLTGQTVSDRFFPVSPALGAIRFSAGYDSTADYYKKDAYIETAAAPDSIAEFSGQTTFGLSQYGYVSIVITKDMINTLKFIESNGFTEYFNNEPGTEFAGVKVISAKRDTNDYYYYGGESFHFMGGWSKTYNDYSRFSSAYKVTDKAVINEIAENSQISYFNSAAGYFVRFELKNNGGNTTMYIPANKMPQSVIDAVSSFIAVEPQYSVDKYMP